MSDSHKKLGSDPFSFGSLQLEPNKPDFRELENLGSPISPLRAQPSGPTTTSSSSSSSASGSGRPESLKRNEKRHSGELSASGDSSPTASVSVRSGLTSRIPQPGHHRSDSIGSGQTGSVSSPPPPSCNILPAGNICPSGRISMARPGSKTDVLGTGSGHYGHGSIMRGGGGSGIDVNTSTLRRSNVGEVGGRKGCGLVLDPEEVKREGNEEYKKGNFVEALRLYEKAINLSPGNAAYRSNRAAALTGLGRLNEAVKECEEAVRLNPKFWRAHQRLGSLFIRLGQVENARRHLCIPGHGQQPDPAEMLKLQAVEKHMTKCADARKIGDWKSALREVDATIAAGANSSPQLFACKAEALLKLHKLADPDQSLSNILQFEQSTHSSSQAKFFGIISEAYLHFVRAQIEMSLGRFDNAVSSAEKAGQIDSRNAEVSIMIKNVKLVRRARARGNDLYKSERFTEACSAYGEGLKIDPTNSVLYCNRAACWFNIGMWERSIEDCNQALSIQPSYTKALLRRAASNCKLERWVDAVRDYEALRRELPDDIGIAESLFHAQVALKKSRGEDVHNMKFGGEVEAISDLEQFKAAISSPGVTVVHFKAASDSRCQEISPYVDQICQRYPSINFLKVDVEESPEVANLENVKISPTFKIYRNGTRLKEMICPSRQVLESSVRHYSF